MRVHDRVEGPSKWTARLAGWRRSLLSTDANLDRAAVRRLVDSLDTLWIMGMRAEFDEAVAWVRLSYDDWIFLQDHPLLYGDAST
eukprot:SAG11_NODE_5979_length_1420_cov_1.020439_3_plen_85_part_00